MMRICLLFFIVLFLGSSLITHAQEPPSNLQGNEMKNWLKANYYTGNIVPLDYSEARRKMYAFVDNKNNSITCVYSGYTQPWDFGDQVTNRPPINTEHTVPQSFFEEAEPMKSDMHHLYPTYGAWNTLRSAFPFGEIDDNETEQWVRNETSQEQIPSNATKDEWSEYKFGMFEPREDHKGDVARSIFYFYTMYPEYDISRVADVETLCEWNIEDPVSQKEIDRNQGIDVYQKNLNPFILYPNVASNVYGCPSIPTGLADNALANKIESMIMVPTGSNNVFTLRIVSRLAGNATVEIYSLEGRKLHDKHVELFKGTNDVILELGNEWSKGIYISSLIFEQHIESRSFLIAE